MLKLDKYDKKLLYELDKKANLPLSVLASKLHRSKQVILYRMKKLEEDGIITGYHAIVDMAKLGYFSFRIYRREIRPPPSSSPLPSATNLQVAGGGTLKPV